MLALNSRRHATELLMAHFVEVTLTDKPEICFYHRWPRLSCLQSIRPKDQACSPSGGLFFANYGKKDRIK